MADYTLSAKITGDSAGFEKAFSAAQKSLDTFSAKFENISKKLDSMAKTFAPISAAAAGAGIASGKMALEFEDSMANINTLLDDSSHLKGYENAVKRISGETGLSLDSMADGMYQAISSLGDSGDDTEKIFNVMAKSAKAGGAEVADSVSLISAGMKGYNDVSGETAQKLSDLAFMTAKLGVTTFPEMASSMQPLFPLADSLNVSYEELFGSMATLTGVTGNTAEVSTQLKAVFSNLMAPTKGMQEVLEKYGYTSGQAMLESEGLAGMLEMVQKETGGQADKMAALFSSTEAVTAMTALTGSQFDTFGQKLASMNDVTGTTDAAYQKLITNGDKLRTAWNQIKIAGVELGSTMIDMVAPSIEKIGDKVSDFANWFSSAGESTKRFIVIATGVVTAIAPALLVMSKVAGVVPGIASGIGLLISPIGLVVASAAALSAGFVYLMTTNDAFREQMIGTWQGLQSSVSLIIDNIKEKCTAIFTGIGDGTVLDRISEKFGEIAGRIQPAMDTVRGAVSSAVDFIKLLLSGVFEGFTQTVTNLAPAFQSIFGTLSSLVGTVVGVFSGFFSGLKGGFDGGLNSASGFQTGFMAILGMVSPPLKMILMLFQNFGPEIQNLVGVIGSSLVPIFTTLGTTLGGIATAIFPAVQSCIANLIPAISSIVTIGKELLTSVIQILTSVLPVIVGLINQLAPFLVQLAQIIGRVMAALAPMIAQLVSAVVPVITNIISVVQNIFTVIMNVVTAAMPAVIAVMNVVMSIIQAVIPVLTNIISVITSIASFAITMIANIIAAISPIVAFIGGIISNIISVIAPIITFIANVIATIIGVVGTIAAAVSGVLKVIVSVFSGAFTFISGIWQNILDVVTTIINSVSRIISGISGVVGGVFNGIYSIVSTIMTNVGNFIQGIFDGIQSAWNGLTSFVGGIFDGVSSAVSDLVNTVKGFVNDVIGGINWALDIINKIPGVSISPIPYLLHGTDNWGGGFARMNEGGRGELTYLPNGTQVIPHDISVQYAKEAARTNAVSAEGSGSTESAVYNGVYDAVYSLVRNGVIKNGDGEYSALGINGDDIVRIFKQKNESHKIAHGGLGILDM